MNLHKKYKTTSTKKVQNRTFTKSTETNKSSRVHHNPAQPGTAPAQPTHASRTRAVHSTTLKRDSVPHHSTTLECGIVQICAKIKPREYLQTRGVSERVRALICRFIFVYKIGYKLVMCIPISLIWM